MDIRSFNTKLDSLVVHWLFSYYKNLCDYSRYRLDVINGDLIEYPHIMQPLLFGYMERSGSVRECTKHYLSRRHDHAWIDVEPYDIIKHTLYFGYDLPGGCKICSLPEIKGILMHDYVFNRSFEHSVHDLVYMFKGNADNVYYDIIRNQTTDEDKHGIYFFNDTCCLYKDDKCYRIVFGLEERYYGLMYKYMTTVFDYLTPYKCSNEDFGEPQKLCSDDLYITSCICCNSNFCAGFGAEICPRCNKTL